MKNKITCLLASAALFGATANAEIVLTDDLSAYGYIDMALTDGEGDGNTDTTVAEFELGLSFTPAESKWSAVAELSFDNTDTTTFDINDPALAALGGGDPAAAQAAGRRAGPADRDRPFVGPDDRRDRDRHRFQPNRKRFGLNTGFDLYT